MKNVFSSLRQKADRSDFKRISDDVDKTNEKMQLVKTLSDSLTTVEKSVTKLEWQLPRGKTYRLIVVERGFKSFLHGFSSVKPFSNSDLCK